jgi:hypothetical protein
MVSNKLSSFFPKVVLVILDELVFENNSNRPLHNTVNKYVSSVLCIYYTPSCTHKYHLILITTPYPILHVREPRPKEGLSSWPREHSFFGSIPLPGTTVSEPFGAPTDLREIADPGYVFLD